MPEKMSFLTPTAIKLLEFFMKSQGEFHEREIIRKTGISKGSANKILRSLASNGILIREVKGRMTFYHADIMNPVVRQIKILFNVWELTTFVKRISKFAKKIVLFGSCAEGVDTTESDIDMLLVSDDPACIKNEISRFNLKADRKISPIILNFNGLMKMKHEDRPLYDRIGNGIVLWEME